MGGIDFRCRAFGKTVNEAYRNAVEDAETEYGQDSYNGTISTTDGLEDVTDKYKKSGKTMEKFIDEVLSRANKRDCFAIELVKPIANDMKTKTQVEHLVEKGTKKWLLKYVVHNRSGAIKSFDTKGDAVKCAREYTEKTEETTYVVMEKVLEKGSATVAKIHYKKSSKERKGQWLFFGIGAC